MSLSTQPADPRRDEGIAQPKLGTLGLLRFAWRQLTSMRTALFLLLLLAVAALPGSIFPQRSIDAVRTTDWIARHESAGPILDRLGFFEVYASPWFAAIYLLLLVSLVGCVLPRSKVHWRAMRSQPPRAPKRLERLAAHESVTLDGSPDAVLADVRAALTSRRFRTHSHDDSTVSAEKGYLKETGNLFFHLALIGVILGMAWGHLMGWKGDVIIPVGQTFANTAARFDTLSPGPLVDTANFEPFAMKLTRFDAVFETDVKGQGQFGSPRDFTAYVDFTKEPGAKVEKKVIRVNGPLETGGGTAFLLGNGYAPRLTVKDADGKVTYSEVTPFLAQDNLYTSVGAVKVAGAGPVGKQLGFAGLFLPTAVLDEQGPRSVFPDALEPALALSAFEGTLFPGGRPQSVYSLDTAEMTQLKNKEGTDLLRIWLTPGQTYTLPGGQGSITFDGVERFAGISIRSDPGKEVTLVSALVALLGLLLSLTIRRRRVFVRVAPADDEGRTVVSIGGLAKDDDEGMGEQLEDILTRLKERRT
ncbi:cytochrome c biogenesis protein ResB [Knoellia subterranea]|uniref:Cytochrome C biogenesis protein n=1 Tax=Knoellia subterranea KCTC 19937 TaxID=1385521 RepID=A0A0A0JGK2_9MICO|nr:cytochrome c biogenesis protein ResB [Knoellia subterranea]KGN36278.1 cytochrome C biogenesis protein [Knoellia subterranea KCTC 19937]